MKALGCQPVESTSLSKVLVSDVNLRPLQLAKYEVVVCADARRGGGGGAGSMIHDKSRINETKPPENDAYWMRSIRSKRFAVIYSGFIQDPGLKAHGFKGSDTKPPAQTTNHPVI